jgi:N-acetylglutamate synthase-like GNAT family acetyltransferase
MSNNSIPFNQQITFSIFSGVPSAARALIWDVFFASRQRGIDLPTHFPWIEQTVGTYCLMLSEKNDGPVLATLVLREHNLLSGSRYAMIGMVCVDQAWRGRGLSTQLLVNLLTFAAEQEISSLLLWTGQPSIYSKHGFVPDSCDSFGRVTLDPIRSRSQVGFTKIQGDTARGLPAFAQQIVRFESDAAELVGVETVQGMALAEWKGAMPAVLDLIEAALPETWNLNAFADASIFDEIRRRGHFYAPLPCAKRMVRHLNRPAYIPYISVLDRI